MHSYILLDKSGSMATRWDSSLEAINGYALGLAATIPDTPITLITFDHMNGLQFDVLRSGQPAKLWKPLSPGEAHPRGGTPLFDAIARLATLIENSASERVAVTIVTDGEENSSRDVNRDGAKLRIDNLTGKGFDVSFIGADFNNWKQSEAVGGLYRKTIQTSGAEGMKEAFAATAVSNSTYSQTGQTVDYSDQDRKRAIK